mmetsp:Transcript_677/g.775  ORF Transcript_677/g.775 Transcript_677/m.775 type:complete len:461 (+) Transcript_677:2-1384(+)
MTGSSGGKEGTKQIKGDAEEDSEEENEGDKIGEDIDDEEATPTPKSTLWHHPEGDSLSRLRAMGAFAYTSSQVILKKNAQQHSRIAARALDDGKKGKAERLKKEAEDKEEDDLHILCATQNMHKITLQRALDLRGQLSRTCATVFVPIIEQEEGKSGNKNSEDSKEKLSLFSSSLIDRTMIPPTAAEEVALRQVILTGSCDSIARRAPMGAVKTGSRHRRLTAYISCSNNITEPLYIHPHSVLFKKDPTASLPEYIAHGPLITNLRGDTTYMTCLTTVNPAWIPVLARDCPLLQWGEPLMSPSPFFDPLTDRILCYVIPTYGVHNWELSAVKKPLQECVDSYPTATSEESAPMGFKKADETYRWFARSLLEGSVIPELRAVLRKDKMKDSPALITQKKLSNKVSNILRVLVTAKVQSKLSLITRIKIDPNFLSEEIQQFLLVDMRKDFRKLWSTLSQATK